LTKLNFAKVAIACFYFINIHDSTLVSTLRSNGPGKLIVGVIGDLGIVGNAILKSGGNGINVNNNTGNNAIRIIGTTKSIDKLAPSEVGLLGNRGNLGNAIPISGGKLIDGSLKGKSCTKLIVGTLISIDKPAASLVGLFGNPGKLGNAILISGGKPNAGSLKTGVRKSN